MGLVLTVFLMAPRWTLAVSPLPVDLGTAGNFAVLAGPSITSTSGGTINGNVGIDPGNSLTLGAIPVTINGETHLADAVSLQAQNDLTTAYNDAASRLLPIPVVGGALGGLTLPPGVYKDDGAPASLGLIGTLTLDALGDPDAVWIFQSASTLIAEVNSRVVLANGAQACHVFWQVTSSATLRTGVIFQGNILALEAITLETLATLDGRALARNAAVTLDNNTITLPDCNLILTIISEHGTGTPPAGLPPAGMVYTNAYGSLLTNSITAVETLGGTQYVNTGWSMTGNEPVSGITNTMVMVLTNNAVLTWLWSTNYYLSLTALHGSITNATPGWKPANGTYDLYPAPDTGYAFDHWEVNGINPVPSNAVPLNVTMNGATDVTAVFRSTFIDVSSQVAWNIDWVCNPCKGFFIGTLTIANNNAQKSITAPIWFEVQSSPQYHLRNPTGFDANTGMYYLDISAAVANKLLTIGDGDLALDPGESVTLTGIELIGNVTPTGLVMAVWADPPDAVVASHVMGVAFAMSLPEAFAAATKVKVRGLPLGLTYNATTRMITGVPTKPGAFAVVISAAGVPAQTIMVGIGVLPTWAMGMFNGSIEGGGVASMTVSWQGNVTGKLAFGGKNWAFSAASYTAGGNADEGFLIDAVAKAGPTLLPLTLHVTRAVDPAPPTLSVATGQFNGVQLVLFHDVWSVERAALAPYIGYYTAALPGNEEYGSGYLTFTVDKMGKVKAAGKLADGTGVSTSGALILDEAGRVWTVVYMAPYDYQGGSLFGIVEFVMPVGEAVFLRPLDGVPFLWQSHSPQATSVYGEGFDRELKLSGGWFDKIGNLYDYYRNRVLTVGTNADAPTPELWVGNIAYESVGWNPDGIVLTVTTNKSGMLTGIAAPQAGAPVKVGGVWDYGMNNSVGLKVALTRATGVFNGSFKAWFDYAVGHTSATAHLAKNIEFTGVLTPEREDKGDGIAGRGFFLWADKAQHLNPQNKNIPYSFKWSYDLNILLSEPSP